MVLINLKLYRVVGDIHSEGAVSPGLVYLGCSLNFMSKNGKILPIFLSLIVDKADFSVLNPGHIHQPTVESG